MSVHKKPSLHVCYKLTLNSEILGGVRNEEEAGIRIHNTIPAPVYTSIVICRGAKFSVNVEEGEELNTDTPSNVPFSIQVPFGNTHSMTGLSLRSCAKVTLQVRLWVVPAMDEPELVMVTSGGAIPIFTQDDEIRKIN